MSSLPLDTHCPPGIIPTTAKDLEAALELGMDWSLREGYAWAEDKVWNGLLLRVWEKERWDGGRAARLGARIDRQGLPKLLPGHVPKMMIQSCPTLLVQEHCEEYGRMLTADPSKVRPQPWSREQGGCG